MARPTRSSSAARSASPRSPAASTTARMMAPMSSAAMARSGCCGMSSRASSCRIMSWKPLFDAASSLATGARFSSKSSRRASVGRRSCWWTEAAIKSRKPCCPLVPASAPCASAWNSARSRRLRATISASLPEKYWYKEPMLTPARCATAFVLSPSSPLVSRMRAVASSIVATVCSARSWRGSLRGLREGRFLVVTIAPENTSNSSYSTGARRTRAALFDEVVLDQIDDVRAAPVEHRLDRVQRRAQHLGRLDMRRHHQLEAVGLHVQQGRAGMGQPGLHFMFQFGGRFDVAAVDADRLGHLGEVGVLQIGVGVEQALDFLFQLDEGQRTVVVDGDLDD